MKAVKKDMLLFYLSAIQDEDGKKTFEYYYETYHRQMFQMAYSVLHNTSDAEDAVHNAFLGIVKNVTVLLQASEDKGKCYCIKAAKNAALNILRKRKSQAEDVCIDDMYDIADEHAFEDMIDKVSYEEILSAIKSLDDIYRDTFYMHYVMDMSVKQIAITLDRKVSTVKQQLVRGKKQLMAMLSEEVMTAYDK